MTEEIVFQPGRRTYTTSFGKDTGKSKFYSNAKKSKFGNSSYPSATSYCYNKTRDTHVEKVNLDDDIAHLTHSINALHLDSAKKTKKNLEALKKFESEEKAITVFNSTAVGTLTAAKAKKLIQMQAKLSVPRFIQTYDVIILYDNREDRNTDLVTILKAVNPSMIREGQLPVGDFVLLLNGKLIASIERKRTNDLCGSIQDLRLRKQTGNMELFHGGMTRLILLIEKRRSGTDLKCTCDHEAEAKETGPVGAFGAKPLNLHDIVRQMDSLLFLMDHHLKGADGAGDCAVISEHLHQLVAEYTQTMRSTKELQLEERCSDDLWWLYGDEASYDHEGTSITRSHLIGSMVNRILLQRMIPFISESDRYSAYILLKFMNALNNKGKEIMARFANEPDFDLKSIAKDAENITGDTLKEFLATRQLPVIKDEEVPLQLTPAERDFALQLRCLSKFTMNYVWLVVEKYSNPLKLMKRMMDCNGEESKIEEFMNEFSHLKPAGSTARFGPQRAIDLYNHFMGTSYFCKAGAKNKPDRILKQAAISVATNAAELKVDNELHDVHEAEDEEENDESNESASAV